MSCTYASSSGVFPVQVGTGTFPVDRGIVIQASAGSAIPLYFNVNSGSTNSGYVVCTGGSTTYSTSSDYRLKYDVTDMDKSYALNKILSVRPVNYKWIPGYEGGVELGFIAHELQEVAPECVDGEKDRVHEDGTIFPQAVDVSWLVPSLCAAIQQLESRISELEASIKA